MKSGLDKSSDGLHSAGQAVASHVALPHEEGQSVHAAHNCLSAGGHRTELPLLHNIPLVVPGGGGLLPFPRHLCHRGRPLVIAPTATYII